MLVRERSETLEGSEKASQKENQKPKKNVTRKQANKKTTKILIRKTQRASNQNWSFIVSDKNTSVSVRLLIHYFLSLFLLCFSFSGYFSVREGGGKLMTSKKEEEDEPHLVMK